MRPPAHSRSGEGEKLSSSSQAVSNGVPVPPDGFPQQIAVRNCRPQDESD